MTTTLGTGAIPDGTAVGIGTLGLFLTTPTAGGGIVILTTGITDLIMPIGTLGTMIPGTTVPGIMTLGTAPTTAIEGFIPTGTPGTMIIGIPAIMATTAPVLCLCTAAVARLASMAAPLVPVPLSLQQDTRV